MNLTRNLPAANSTATSDFADKVAELKTLITELAKTAPGAAQENIHALSKQASAKAGDAARSVVKTVRENPIPVIALAAVGTGLLAWYAYSRFTAESSSK